MSDEHHEYSPPPWRWKDDGAHDLETEDGAPLPLSNPRKASEHSEAAGNGRIIEASGDLYEALSAVEWATEEDHPDGGHYRACPCCGGGMTGHFLTPPKHEGHTEDCKLAAALIKARGVHHG